MATKYTAVTVTGYNASPPSDDGSATEANKITWAKHKTKLGDPNKTAIEAINTKLLSAFDTTPTAKTGNYTTTTTDHETAILATSGVTISLGDAASMGTGYIVSVKNASASGSVTVGMATSGNNIDGAASDITLLAKQSAIFVCDGSHYYTISLGYERIPTLTALSSPDPDADYVRVYDADAGVDKKVLTGNISPSYPQNITVLTSGSGTYTTTPTNAKALYIRMCGGGGGGQGTASGGTGSDGGDSTFGALTARGGDSGGNGAAGGSASGGDFNITGGAGGSGDAATVASRGACGGANPFGGAGQGGGANGGAAKNAQDNTGGGGASRGGITGTTGSAASGGAGGYLEKWITSPDAVYAYSVGAGGAGGSGGAGGGAGSNGGSGIIIVISYL